MKRLLVLMMCAMLAIPSMGMNVSATENVPVAVSEPTETELAQLALDVANEINKHYASKEFSENGKKNADEIMSQVAEDLDYEYKNGMLNKK
ncbi:MAG: hypothetical protein IIV45_01105, partial [Lachnospiraceae bacterium]|nr:hypothetical protein [Lachnospiraceae bacterium]